MPKSKSKPLNVKADGNRYTILAAGGSKTVKQRVEAIDVAFGTLGIREEDRHIALDHIPTGLKIGVFATEAMARQACRELIQLSDWQWITVPKRIAADVQKILERLAA